MAPTPTAAFSVRMRVRMLNEPGMLGRLTLAIGEAGANGSTSILPPSCILNVRSSHSRISTPSISSTTARTAS